MLEIFKRAFPQVCDGWKPIDLLDAWGILTGHHVATVPYRKNSAVLSQDNRPEIKDTIRSANVIGPKDLCCSATNVIRMTLGVPKRAAEDAEEATAACLRTG